VGQPSPERRQACFVDPRHGRSVRDVYWTPSSGGPGRTVPACSACAHKVDQGIEPEIRNVEVNGAPVSYVNAGFAPAYWGGFGFGPGLFTGFLLGEALAPLAVGGGFYGYDSQYGDGDPSGGGYCGGGPRGRGGCRRRGLGGGRLGRRGFRGGGLRRGRLRRRGLLIAAQPLPSHCSATAAGTPGGNRPGAPPRVRMKEHTRT